MNKYILQSLFWSVFLHAVGEWTRNVRRKDSFKDAYTFYLSDLPKTKKKQKKICSSSTHNMQKMHQLRN